jgi:hypothetical protein
MDMILYGSITRIGSQLVHYIPASSVCRMQSLAGQYCSVKQEIFNSGIYQDSCPTRVHGYLCKNDTFWMVTDHVQHTCVIMNQLLDHKNLSSTMIARLFYTQLIVKGKVMEVKAI